MTKSDIGLSLQDQREWRYIERRRLIKEDLDRRALYRIGVSREDTNEAMIITLMNIARLDEEIRELDSKLGERI